MVLESVCEPCTTYSWANCGGTHLNVPSDIHTLDFYKTRLPKSDINTRRTCLSPRSSFPIRKSAPESSFLYFSLRFIRSSALLGSLSSSLLLARNILIFKNCVVDMEVDASIESVFSWLDKSAIICLVGKVGLRQHC